MCIKTHDVVLFDSVVSPVPGFLDLVATPMGRRLRLVLVHRRFSYLVHLLLVPVARLLVDRGVVGDVRVHSHLERPQLKFQL